MQISPSLTWRERILLKVALSLLCRLAMPCVVSGSSILSTTDYRQRRYIVHSFLCDVLRSQFILQNERVFDIADVPFSQVSDKEKLAYTGNILETGTDQGYKPRQYWVSACV